MAQSNYDKTLARMPGEFLKYDQQRMIRMFCHDYDAEFLYLRLLDRCYRISRRLGTIEWEGESSWKPAGFLEAMTIYDLLCCAKDGAGAFGQVLSSRAPARHDARGKPREGRVRRVCGALR